MVLVPGGYSIEESLQDRSKHISEVEALPLVLPHLHSVKPLIKKDSNSMVNHCLRISFSRLINTGTSQYTEGLSSNALATFGN
jgi:hypothetical protein